MLSAIVPREQMHVLQHQAEQRRAARAGPSRGRPRRRPGSVRVSHFVEAQQQVDQRRLPRAGGADDADALPGLDLERHVAEDEVGFAGLGRVVGEPDVIEDDVARRRRRAGSRRRRRWVFDRHRLVEQLEDPLRRGHRRLQDVELVRHVGDRPEEALRVEQEGDQRSERQRSAAAPGRPPYQIVSAEASAPIISIAG